MPLRVHGQDIISEAVLGDGEHRVAGEGVPVHRLAEEDAAEGNR
jgi:hypothetical protein